MRTLIAALAIALASLSAHALNPGEGKAFTPVCKDGKLVGAAVAALSEGAPFVAFMVEFDGETICKGEPDTFQPVAPAEPKPEPPKRQPYPELKPPTKRAA